MLPDERMVEAARRHFYGPGYEEGVPGMLRVAFAAPDREALIEAGADALREMPAEERDLPYSQAGAVLRAVGLIA